MQATLCAVCVGSMGWAAGGGDWPAGPCMTHRGSEVENGWGWLGECGVGAAFSSLLEVIRCSDSLIGIYSEYFFPLSFFFLYLFQRSTVESLRKFSVPTRVLRQMEHMSSNLRDEERSRIILVTLPIQEPGLLCRATRMTWWARRRPSDSGCSTIPLTMSEPIQQLDLTRERGLEARWYVEHRIMTAQLHSHSHANPGFCGITIQAPSVA